MHTGPGVFLCLVHNFINHFRKIFIREDQGEVITSAGLKQFRVGEHSTPSWQNNGE